MGSKNDELDYKNTISTLFVVTDDDTWGNDGRLGGTGWSLLPKVHQCSFHGGGYGEDTKENQRINKL